MRSNLMLCSFFCWILLFSACDEKSQLDATLTRPWLLVNTVLGDCADEDDESEDLVWCDERKCETLIFFPDQTWQRSNFEEGFTERESGTYTWVNETTLMMCAGAAPCTDGKTYEARVSAQMLILSEPSVDPPSCERSEVYVEHPDARRRMIWQY